MFSSLLEQHPAIPLPILRQCPPIIPHEFLALTDDCKTGIRITLRGDGAFGLVRPNQPDVRHVFNAFALKHAVLTWPKLAHLPWVIHQFTIPEVYAFDQPIRRYFKLTFFGADLSPCLFTHGNLAEVSAFEILKQHDDTAFFAVPSGYIVNMHHDRVVDKLSAIHFPNNPTLSDPDAVERN